jgi:hypothetical protein
MPASVFAIAHRHREHENQIAGPGDFTLMAEGERDVFRVLGDPACSLYCLDPATQRALFVETPPGIELHEAPFLYQAQFQHAQRIIAIAYEELIPAAAEYRAAASDVAFLYSVGRSGSTLLGRALHSLPDVICVAEPDAPISCIAPSLTTQGSELLKTCIGLLCRPDPRKRASHHVIKLRHLGIKLAGALHQLYPASRALFVYRNAIDFVQSTLRAFHPLPPQIRDYHQDPVRYVAKAWQSMMQQYLALHRSGVAISALRYEDLNREPQKALAAVARWYRLPALDLATTSGVFAVDAQAGSNLSRESLRRKSIDEFGSAAQLAEKVRETLANHQEINQPDLVLPGTLASDE